MQLGTLEQLIRIAIYTGASYWLGESVAQGEMVQAAIGGFIAVLNFGWWVFRERQVKTS